MSYAAGRDLSLPLFVNDRNILWNKQMSIAVDGSGIDGFDDENK
jgi:hypothetical protein